MHEALVRKRKQGDDKNKEKGHKNFLKLLNVVSMAQGSEKRKEEFLHVSPTRTKKIVGKKSFFPRTLRNHKFVPT